ncbi:Phospholipase/Carboxylesterase [Planctomycetes bacterium CA13]|uniref:Phospholipase/Carboxylesterase n=1 Tax=Novipirellula herctigrandis TaxID=2527986 RepID=A0A5C5Z4W3_9BACT|nr:Phospholipase/Carboxylesterase [Planctomycetes bacterium CA13]
MLKPRPALYGSLDCIVVDGGDSPSIPVVLCHGYGAPGTDLAGLAFEWMSLLGEDAGRFRFIFPAAPLTLAELGMPDGRAWWPINMAQLAESIQASRFSDMHEHEPDGITEARESLCKAIAEIKAELGGESTQLVLGGFSQGAMLTLDATLRGPIDPPSLLLLYSGTLICKDEWEKALTRLNNTRVYQAHGTFDPILPYPSAVELSEILKNAGVKAEFHGFEGPHTIDTDSIIRTAQLLRELVAESP